MSLWWRNIQALEKGEGGLNANWFKEKLSREIGNGSKSLFWEDPWVGGRSLKDLYPGLYRLVADKNVVVRDAFMRLCDATGWIGGLDEENKKLVEEICERVQNLTMKDEAKDIWRWSKSDFSC